ncbi:MAG: DUF4174 domain-containing protein [Congregibacter sp.]|nr:DUF4174 domain-containing protein [Congregibacter sp.]
MKTQRFVVALFLLAACRLIVASDAAVLSDLRELRWQFRVVIIDKPEQTDSVLELLSANADALADRRLMFFVLHDHDHNHDAAVSSNFPGSLASGLAENIRQQWLLDGVAVLLIGLDGGVKARAENFDLESLFALIDAMPMRRSEQG